MRNLRYGSVPTCGKPPVFVVPDQLPSQFNDFYQRKLAMPYGRALRGLENEESPKGFYRDSWAGADDATNQAAVEDDNVGNGIFDGPGSAPVQNAGTGVFQANYAEPGFLYREQLTQKSAIVDARTGGPMVFRPAGGGWPKDMAESYRPYDSEVPRHYPVNGLGETPSTSASLGQWAVAGLVVGAAVALVVGTLKIKG